MTDEEARKADLAIARSLRGKLCSDCPPADFPESPTRCAPCPRRKGTLPGYALNWAAKPDPDAEYHRRRRPDTPYPAGETWGFDPNEAENAQREVMCALPDNIDDLIGMEP